MRSTVLGFSAGILLALLAQQAQAGDGLVALQTADASCPDDSGNVYVDCGNGTVTDNRSGLVWLQDASCFGVAEWQDALDLVATLSDIPAGSAAAGQDCGLSDGSSPGEWRLPTIDEWEAMIANALGLNGDPNCTGAVDAPTITNDAGTDCWKIGPSSFIDVEASGYWAANSDANSLDQAWTVALLVGTVQTFLKSSAGYVWPVRGGQ